MREILSTVAFTAINLFVLYYILKKLTFKPLMRFLDNRSRSIQDRINQAEARHREAEELHQQYIKQLDEVKAQTDHMLKEAKAQAEQHMNAIIEQAKAQADHIIEKARQDAQREKEQTMQQAKDEMASLILNAVSEILEQSLDADTDERFIKSFIENGLGRQSNA